MIQTRPTPFRRLFRLAPQHKRGQAIVELSLAVGLFVLFVIAGIVDFGFALRNLLLLQQLCNDAAQFAAESNGTQGVLTASEVTAYVMNKRPPSWTQPITVLYTNPFPLPSGDRAVRVVLESSSPLYTPVFQRLAEIVMGKPALPLRVFAVYKIPLVLVNR